MKWVSYVFLLACWPAGLASAQALPNISSLQVRYNGQKNAAKAEGELKKLRFDPLFSLNHTCAMLRANINRLFRRTWCTTKKKERLEQHLAVYMDFHNRVLLDGDPNSYQAPEGKIPLDARPSLATPK